MSGIVKAICQIGVFMICAQAFVHFRPKASYEKYLKMLVSAMVLVQLFLSVKGIFSPEGEKLFTERTKWFAEGLEEQMQQAAEDTFFSEKALEFPGMEAQQGMKNAEETMETLPKITVEILPIGDISVDTMK